jgi:hypothetical protein
MEIQHIKILLDRYNKAEATLDEEQLLREYFTVHTDIPEELRIYQPQFVYFNSMRDDPAQITDLKKKLEGLIEAEAIKKPVVRLSKRIYRYIAAAAAVLLLVSLSLVMLNKTTKPNLGTFNDPELAYIEAQKTLLYISQTLNYGTKDLSNLSKLNSGIDNLRHLEKLNSGLNKLKLISKLDEIKTEEKK